MLKFPGSIEAHLRSLGMPTILKEGKIILLNDFIVCTEGKQMTVDQAQILKLLDIRMAEFRLAPAAVWEKKNASFKTL